MHIYSIFTISLEVTPKHTLKAAWKQYQESHDDHSHHATPVTTKPYA